MIRVVFAEWRKLRRPTLFLGTIGAALFFTGLTNTFLYLLIDSDYEFGANFKILHVPGHTPGELSILLTLPNTGSILLTSDAISRESEVSEGCLDATDPAQAIASANRILDLAKAHNAFVIYGHGPEQWKELKKAPDLYN